MDASPKSESTSAHLLLVPIPAWGHIRPLCVLASRIVYERPDATITMISSPMFLEKTIHEFETLVEGFGFGDKDWYMERIRVIAPFSLPAGDPKASLYAAVSAVANSFSTVFTTLLNEQPISCFIKGTIFPPVSPPCLVMVDYFPISPGLLRISKSLAPSVPVVAWISCGGATMLRRYGPEALGGLGELGLRIDEEAKKTGRDPIEVGNEMFGKIDGTVVKIPGLPEMYDWEYLPQNLPLKVPVSTLLREGSAMIREADAVLTASAYAYEPTTLNAIRSWIHSTDRPIYAVGPLLPSAYGETQEFQEKDKNIEKFLEDQLRKHGKRSVLFISFGTMFWPTVPEYLEELVDALIDCQIPHILCHASPFAKVPESIKVKTEASSLGLLSPWAPQHAVLNHPATGWFLTHGGYGSVMESLGSGVPLIFWPFNGDQPTNAVHVSTNLRAGIELLQVRTGNGLRPLRRDGREATGTREAVGKEFRELFTGLKGEEGVKLRTNAERLKVEFESTWREGGYARSALETMLDRWL